MAKSFLQPSVIRKIITALLEASSEAADKSGTRVSGVVEISSDQDFFKYNNAGGGISYPIPPANTSVNLSTTRSIDSSRVVKIKVEWETN